MSFESYQSRTLRLKKRRNLTILVSLFLLLFLSLITMILLIVLNNLSLSNKQPVNNSTIAKVSSINNSSSENLVSSSQQAESSVSAIVSDALSSSQEELLDSTADEIALSTIVPATPPVGNDYFADSAFIGDSRTQGLQMYTSIPGATFYTSKGLMVDTIFTKTAVPNEDGTEATIIDALRANTFEKIYVMLGVNELGWVSVDAFIEKYSTLVDTIKASQPSAKIYIQSILPVSEEKSNTHSYIQNPRIDLYNQRILQMAQEKFVYYLNVSEIMKNENNALFPNASTDGVHLSKDYCLNWLEYLKNHTVS